MTDNLLLMLHRADPERPGSIIHRPAHGYFSTFFPSSQYNRCTSKREQKKVNEAGEVCLLGSCKAGSALEGIKKKILYKILDTQTTEDESFTNQEHNTCVVSIQHCHSEYHWKQPV